jgi:hypothetical protein
MSLSANAHATDINFSFDNVSGNVPGTVSGRIFGLVDNTNSAATEILITSVPAAIAGGVPPTSFSAFGSATSVGQYITFNSFTLSGGVVTDAVFQIYGGYFDLNLQPAFGDAFYNELLSSDVSLSVQNKNGFAGVTFSSVPEPVSMALLGVGVLGLAAARRRSIA